MDLPGIFASPTRRQLNKEKYISPSQFARENLVTRDGLYMRLSTFVVEDDSNGPGLIIT